MLLRVDVWGRGGASADTPRGHSSPSLTTTPMRPVFFRPPTTSAPTNPTSPDGPPQAPTDRPRPQRTAPGPDGPPPGPGGPDEPRQAPTSRARPRLAAPDPLDRWIIGVLSAQNPDNPTVDERPPA